MLSTLDNNNDSGLEQHPHSEYPYTGQLRSGHTWSVRPQFKNPWVLAGIILLGGVGTILIMIGIIYLCVFLMSNNDRSTDSTLNENVALSNMTQSNTTQSNTTQSNTTQSNNRNVSNTSSITIS